ncbi:mannose-6-phosphate isomerase [Vibrio sinaloensis DSM 21326]|uniref:mannose-6-phosphate isomerase n=1 Tax=Vibrio sinaloensis DSM 21326 TaxID=945550 RepID=E8M3Y3_PHOS4|nr:mannose-6-phosphate isomerase, class I [Vibrio sinaloensis]EGA71326.1 mannose-6-phosphate isomerase [Vibrio sinaloensis DSM 21326]
MSELPIYTPSLLQRFFYPMTNVIQNYAWGSASSFNQLFGIENASGEPQAEIWMGAHPNGCSMVNTGAEQTKLSHLINQDLSLFLSEKVAQRFGELPYLFKVLAADKALSIQVHPNKRQAEHGYELEQKQGIPLSAGHRNYKDPNHKPELVYALTDYTAMNGFRPVDEILRHFHQLDIPELRQLVNELNADQSSQGLASFFAGLLSLEGESKEMALTLLLLKAELSGDGVYALILELSRQYPNDVGLFAPLLLNVITLSPGQAMFLDAETPHAYIKGTGLEIMANSDNVLRAGLTPKHMDVKELIACTKFATKPHESLLLEPVQKDNISEYPIPVEDFRFAILQRSARRKVTTQGAEILLPLDEAMTLTHPCGETCVIDKGQSVFIPAYTKDYLIDCAGRVARAYS